MKNKISIVWYFIYIFRVFIYMSMNTLIYLCDLYMTFYIIFANIIRLKKVKRFQNCTYIDNPGYPSAYNDIVTHQNDDIIQML